MYNLPFDRIEKLFVDTFDFIDKMFKCIVLRHIRINSLAYILYYRHNKCICTNYIFCIFEATHCLLIPNIFASFYS